MVGDRKKFKGKFKLYKTNDIFKYWQAALLENGKTPYLKDFRPIVKLDVEGVIVGKDKFMIDNGDIFIIKNL